jgi:hypothetical protein
MNYFNYNSRAVDVQNLLDELAFLIIRYTRIKENQLFYRDIIKDFNITSMSGEQSRNWLFAGSANELSSIAEKLENIRNRLIELTVTEPLKEQVKQQKQQQRKPPRIVTSTGFYYDEHGQLRRLPPHKLPKPSSYYYGDDNDIDDATQGAADDNENNDNSNDSQAVF